MSLVIELIAANLCSRAKPISLWVQEWDAERSRRAIESYPGFSRTALVIRVDMNLGDPMRRAWLSPSTKVVVSFRESEMSIVVLIRETL